MAIADLQGHYDYSAQFSQVDAARRLDRFQIALQSLAERPDRCGMARENGKVDIELREFLFGKKPNVFRVLFTIDHDTVRILRVRRAQRKSLTLDDLRHAISDQ